MENKTEKQIKRINKRLRLLEMVFKDTTDCLICNNKTRFQDLTDLGKDELCEYHRIRYNLINK